MQQMFAQLVTYLILSHPLYHLFWIVLFLNTSPLEDKIVVLKLEYELYASSKDDTNIMHALKVKKLWTNLQLVTFFLL
jgi:hypothetical protein